MTNEEIKQLIAQHFPQAIIEVRGDGCSLEATIVSDAFNGLSPVKRQQAVYRHLGDHIISGALHAVTLRTLTPDEQGA